MSLILLKYKEFPWAQRYVLYICDLHPTPLAVRFVLVSWYIKADNSNKGEAFFQLQQDRQTYYRNCFVAFRNSIIYILLVTTTIQYICFDQNIVKADNFQVSNFQILNYLRGTVPIRYKQKSLLHYCNEYWRRNVANPFPILIRLVFWTQVV